MIFFPALIDGLETAIKDYHEGRAVPPNECHKIVSECYNWHNVSQRTEIVYARIVDLPHPSLGLQLAKYIFPIYGLLFKFSDLNYILSTLKLIKYFFYLFCVK